jgi:tetratricopeptide (TPR) repeat protein
MAWMLLHNSTMKGKLLCLLICLLWGLPSQPSALTLEEGIKEPPLRQAWEAVKKNQPAQAIQALSAMPQGSDRSVYYHLVYGRALEKAGKPSEAMEHFRSAYLNAPSGEPKELALFERAEAYFRMRNFYESRMTYALFLKQYPRSPYVEQASLGMARSLVQIGMASEALPFFEKAGHSIEAVMGRANILHRLGRVKEADDWFRKGLSQDREYFLRSEETLLNFGENLVQEGKDQEALSYLTMKYKNTALQGRADFNLGLVSLKARKADEAQRHFQSALTEGDRKTKQEALLHLAEAQWEGGRKKESYKLLTEYRRAYGAGSMNPSLLGRMAQVDLDEGRADKGVQGIQEMVSRFKPQKDNFSEIETLISQVKTKAPERLVPLWKAIGPKILPLSAESFLVSLAEGLKKDEKSYLEIQTWLAGHGSEKIKTKSLMDLAGYQIELGRFNEAMGTFKALGKGKLAKDDMLRLEARMFYAKKDYAATVERLLALKKIQQEDLPLLQDTLRYARDPNRAAVAFATALSHLQGNSSSYITMGDLLYEKGRKKEALPYYQKALDKDPLNEWALYRSGMLLGGEEIQKRLGAIKNDRSLVGKLAQTSLRENKLERKFEEIF